MTDVWALNVAYPSERMGYPTQKPLALLNCIIRCGSDEGVALSRQRLGTGALEDSDV